MTFIALLLIVLATAAVTGWLAHLVAHDGLGHRPPPSSAPEWWSGSPASWSR